jgi:uncharacterized glyoxalase superfamily protein PhnB
MADASSRPVFTPTLYYLDPFAAIRWLEQAFGFELEALVTDAQGRLGHSQLSYRGAPIAVHGEFSSPELLGPAEMKSPASLSGGCCQFVRVAVEGDVDAHCERARAAGARITQAPVDEFYGERIYRALDPEGHVWVFTQPIAQVSFAEMEAATGLKFSTSLEEANP